LADVIVNTSPLQYLHQVGQLDLFPKLFGKIIVPEAVAAELSAGRRLGVSLPEPEVLDWIHLRHPASPVGGLLSWDLGRGSRRCCPLRWSVRDRGSFWTTNWRGRRQFI
jgi:predicted nucleic acid-binding protein